MCYRSLSYIMEVQKALKAFRLHTTFIDKRNTNASIFELADCALLRARKIQRKRGKPKPLQPLSCVYEYYRYRK